MESMCGAVNYQLEKEKTAGEDKDSKIQHLTERLNSITEKDKELERIFDYVSDMNRINMVYIPVENDKIDKQLADIINTAGRHNDLNKAKMLLVREGDGHYTYCKKKVFIMKNDKDNLIVRVGGGYMSFEQFI